MRTALIGPLIAGVMALAGNQAAGVIGGTVVDAASGAPVPHARVRLTGFTRGTRTIAETSDEQGRFAFVGLSADKYELDATAPGFAPGVFGRFFPDAALHPIDLASGETSSDNAVYLWRLGVITGSVLDEGGEPVANVDVEALREQMRGARRAWGAVAHAKTNDLGVYRLSGLAPGDYAVGVPRQTFMGSTATGLPTIYYPNAASACHGASIEIEPGTERSGIDFPLPVPATVHRLSGRLDGLESGRAVDVSLTPAGARDCPTGLETVQTKASPGGAFAFDSVATGAYVLSVADIPQTGGLAGVGTAWTQGAAGIVSPEPSLPPTPSQPSLWGEQEIVIDQRDVTNVVVPLREGARFTGVVRFDRTGAVPPLTGGLSPCIVIDSADGRDLGHIPLVPIAADLTFRSGSLPPGRYEVSPFTQHTTWSNWTLESLTVGGRELAGSSLTLQSADVNVTITLTDRVTSLSGTVRGADGTPQPNRQVIALASDPSLREQLLWAPSRVDSTRTAADGTYEFRGLLPGDYIVAVLPSTLRPWVVPDDRDLPEPVSAHLALGQAAKLNLTGR